MECRSANMRLTISILAAAQFLLGFALSVSGALDQSFPRITTPLGIVEGYYKTSNAGRRYEAYEGIPYAEPPIGDARFEVARRVSPWTGIRMGKSLGPICMQFNKYSSNQVVGNEDCLYMNIYTASGHERNRRTNGKSVDLLPVIFYIQEGAFQMRSGSENGPKYLLDRDVTLVTFNYRLGPLGFLSTGDRTVCGNMGLKDQVIALKWVKNNIEYFGGDPSRITIIGGASAHYHYLTKLTTGLFNRGMSLESVALDPWAQMKCALEKAKKLATLVGCSTNDVPAMVDCLRDRPAHQIVLAVGEFMPWLENPIPAFGPTVEAEGCEFTYIDQQPIEIITSGEAHDLPWIVGIVSEPGLVDANAFVANDGLLAELDDNWTTLSSYVLDLNYTVSISDLPRVTRLIRNHYLGTNPISRLTVNQTVRIISDRRFNYEGAEAAILQAQFYRSPVRFYRFSYRGAHSLSEIVSGSTENFGVSVGDNTAYVLQTSVNTSTTSQDRAMQRKMIDLWVSFAANGTPEVGVKWPALKRRDRRLDFLEIAGPRNMGMRSSRDFGQMRFWKSLGIRENPLTKVGNTYGLNCVRV